MVGQRDLLKQLKLMWELFYLLRDQSILIQMKKITLKK